MLHGTRANKKREVRRCYCCCCCCCAGAKLAGTAYVKGGVAGTDLHVDLGAVLEEQPHDTLIAVHGALEERCGREGLPRHGVATIWVGALLEKQRQLALLLVSRILEQQSNGRATRLSRRRYRLARARATGRGFEGRDGWTRVL